MTPRWFNTIGLSLTILGCLLLYRFGLSADVDLQGRKVITTSDRDGAEIAKGRHYVRMGRLGVLLIVIGSALQICAVWTR